MIVLTAPTVPDVPPVVEVAPPESMTWTWSAPWLERSWDLTDAAGSVLKTVGATLPQADPDHWYGETPSLSGSSWQGYRTPMSQAFIPVFIDALSRDEFFATHAAFMDSLDPAHEGVLRVTRPDGQWREVSLRYVSAATGSTGDVNVVEGLYTSYGITWDAAEPFWRGAPIVNRFAYPSSTPAFFTGPPFRLAPSEVLGAATVVNPGEAEAYAVYRLEGPFSTFSVGIGDSLVEGAITKPAGGWLEIDMTPSRLTVLDEAGDDRWDDLTDVAFEAIPPGSTSLRTVLSGASAGSAVSVSFTPRYRRAY